MPSRSSLLRTVAVWLILSMYSLGCGGSDAFETAPVQGTATYKGQPITQGTLILQPKEGRPAYGTIKDGQIVDVMTYTRGDGAIVGPHQCAIQAVEPNPENDMAPGKSLIPEKFASPKTSGLTAEIVAGKSNELHFDLAD